MIFQINKPRDKRKSMYKSSGQVSRLSNVNIRRLSHSVRNCARVDPAQKEGTLEEDDNTPKQALSPKRLRPKSYVMALSESTYMYIMADERHSSYSGEYSTLGKTSSHIESLNNCYLYIRETDKRSNYSV